MKPRRKNVKGALSVQRPRDPGRAVQNRAAAENRTESAIAKTVQPAIVEVPMQDFRAKLKAYIDGESAVLVKSSYRTRAIVLPVHESWSFGHESSDERKGRLTRLFVAALEKVAR